jgi:NAD(P)-dependent dehydrogenase (short-subunit alcohol dehydrogenase family)
MAPIALILGAGPRIGASVTKTFISNGYKVVLVSRNGAQTSDGVLSLKADFAKPESIPAIFDAVKAEFHAAPSVVVYNAGSFTMPPVKESVLSVPAESIKSDFDVNTLSPYVAAQQAVLGWETLPTEIPKTFIYTGNITNVSIVPMPMMLTIGMGKSASAFWIGLADAMYSTQGYR